jgi:hypothetical protein
MIAQVPPHRFASVVEPASQAFLTKRWGQPVTVGSHVRSKRQQSFDQCGACDDAVRWILWISCRKPESTYAGAAIYRQDGEVDLAQERLEADVEPDAAFARERGSSDNSPNV